MPTVRVVHWREAEAGPMLEACRKTRFRIEYLPGAGGGGSPGKAIRAGMPDVVVIDLSRLPSHGREVAVWLRNTKQTRSAPIIFVGGEPSKVATVRAVLPDATYCEVDKVAEVFRKLTKGFPKPDPVIPPSMMERSRDKSAAHKSDIPAGATVAVIEPPRDFPALLGALPKPVEFQEDDAPITLWFVHDREALLDSLREMRVAAAKTKLWLLWKKGSSRNGITRNSLREMLREVGLVDYKICAVDQRWSALLLTRKKS